MSVQELPYNAVAYDGDKAAFDWQTPEGAKLTGRSASAFNALTRVRLAANAISKSVEQVSAAVNEIVARGFVSREALPPFRLPGDLASLDIDDLAPALAVAQSLIKWLNTPLEIAPGVTVVPAVVMQRVA